MEDYKKMYFELFNEITDIIEKLKEIQIKAEERYVEAEEQDFFGIKETKIFLKIMFTWVLHTPEPRFSA